MTSGSAVLPATPEGTISALMDVATPENGAIHEAFITFISFDLADPVLWRAINARFVKVHPELSRRRP